MNYILPLSKIDRKDRPKVGGKAFSLALMAGAGMAVPPALCITTEAYDRFLDSTGLRSEIIFELYRKPFNEMRWEEIWDTALRIRNLFAKTLIPVDISEAIKPFIQSMFGNRALAVRSSAPGEDSSKTSFAGLHESYVNMHSFLTPTRADPAVSKPDPALKFPRCFKMHPDTIDLMQAYRKFLQ